MPSLRAFFENEREQRKALCAAKGDGWLDPSGNASLYNWSRRAFDPTTTPDDAFRYFKRIYDDLSRYWKWWRPYSPERCWPPEQIFETLRNEFAEFSWDSTFNLKDSLPKESVLIPPLIKIRGIKPKNDYPIMAVSKFLHFYNPSLFPIYDEEWMWKKVCNGHFRTDYVQFRSLENRPWSHPDDETSIPFYMRWANSLLSVAHPAFMQVFADWFNERTTTCEKAFDVSELCATAFEFTAIGAVAAVERT